MAELICRYDGPEPYVDGLLFQVTSRFGQVEVEHHPRYAGKSNYTLMRSIAVWARLATGHSVRPLRLVTWCGLGLGLLGGLLAVRCPSLPPPLPERLPVGGRRLGFADGHPSSCSAAAG